MRLVPAVAVEHLDAVVLAVRHIDKAVGVGCDVVDDVELAGIGARLAPGFDQSAVWRVFVDAGVAVPVRDVDLAFGRERSMGTAVEGLAAHERRRLVRDADGQQPLAVGRALAHRMVAIIGAIEIILGVDVQTMRAVEQAFAPACDEIALAVEHDHRVGAAIEDIDAVLAVDRDRCDISEIPVLRQLRPILHHAVAVFARAENGRHVCFPPNDVILMAVIPGWPEGPAPESRDSGSRLPAPRKDIYGIHAKAASGIAARGTRGKSSSSIALICSARYLELIRHCARLPAMNHSPGCAVRVYMLRSS